MKLPIEEMISAMRAADARYNGKFFICVKTTKIYCLPSCRPPRKPLLKNVEFVEAQQEAEAKGYRGCKLCRSEFYPNTQPPWLADVLSMITNAGDRKLNEDTLAEAAGVDISTIRRYFKSYQNTTPLALHRKVRLEHAHKLMKRGANYLTAAYETGFESSSGFRDAFIKHYGYPPGRTHAL